MGGHGTGGHMEHAGHQLTGQLVHIGDHEQQALRSGVGGGQGTGGQRAVDGTGSASLGLHLHHLHGLAKDVLPASSGPLIHIVRHGAGRSDGVNTRNLCECVGHVSGSGVAVHSFELTCHFRFLLLLLSKELRHLNSEYTSVYHISPINSMNNSIFSCKFSHTFPSPLLSGE